MMNWDYIAGFFDGEGSVTSNNKRCRVTISQTDYKVLQDIKNFTKVGGVFEVKKRKTHWKDAWVFYTAGQDDTYYFLKNICNRTVVKQQAIKNALELLRRIISNRRRRERLLKWRIRMSIKLRGQGLSYRAIGKKLKMDWGYTRRLLKKLNI